MAYVIPDVVDTYEDLPLTNFPTTEDTHSRMTDVTGALLPLVMQYNELYNAGNLTDAAQLLKDNPALTDCIFNADRRRFEIGQKARRQSAGLRRLDAQRRYTVSQRGARLRF